MSKVTAPGGTIPQAGAVPFRTLDDGSVEVLLITNSNGKWIVPKGGIDDGHTARQTAHIECLEEAGVRGILLTSELGHYSYTKAEGSHRVQLFALRVTEILSSWPENKRRKRQWLTVKDAASRVEFEDLSRVIARVTSVA
jgi:8-oxo-dGTP pyrophosphatase MutT (NUDIX family)